MNRILDGLQRRPLLVILYFVFFLLLSQSVLADEVALEALAAPHSAEEWFLVGNIFFDAGEYNDAIGSWHNAMILDAAFAADAWYNIGLAYAHAQLYQDAILAWMQSIEFNPAFAASYDNMATAYLILGMPKEAFMAYNNAVAIEPMEAKYTNDRNFFIENLKDIASEVEDSAFPIERWNDIGTILYYEGNIAAAQKAWQKAVVPGATHAVNSVIIAKAWKNIAITYMEQKDYASAMSAWHNSIEGDPDGSAYNDLGYCYIMLDMPEKALSAFEYALALEPENKIFSDNKNNLLELFPEMLDEDEK